MAGASAGYFLADQGDVILLERESQPGYHTTGRSAALLFEGYGNAVIRAITKAGADLLETLQTGFPMPPSLSPRGGLLVAKSDQVERLDEAEAEEANRRIGRTSFSGDRLFEVALFLKRDLFVGGLLEPGAMDMDVNAMLQGFLRGFRGKGGALMREAGVVSLTRDQGTWTIETTAGRVEVKIVVNAAGAWADAVAEMAERRPSVWCRSGGPRSLSTGLQIRISTHAATASVDESWYIKPDAGRVFGSPADETPSAPCDAQPEELDLAIAADRIMTNTSLEIRRFASTCRTSELCRRQIPGRGFRPKARRFLLAGGTRRVRHPNQPRHGRLTASLIAGTGVPTDIAVTQQDLAPDREALVRAIERLAPNARRIL